MNNSEIKELDILFNEIKNYPPSKLLFFKKELNHLINKINASYENKNHATSKINDIDIDKNIKKLIKLIWKCDIDTNNSCEDNVPKNYIWISFDSYNDFYKFISIITINLDPDTFDRILYSQESDLDSWIYDINMNDSRLFKDFDDSNDSEHENYMEYHNNHPYIIEPSFSVRFPKKDYNFVCNQLNNYLKAKKDEN